MKSNHQSKNVYFTGSGIVFIILIIMSAGLSIYSIYTRPKTGFVEIGKLYNSFTYKKELETEYKNIEAKRKNILDSMKLNFNVFIRQNQNNLSKDAIKKQVQLMQEQYQMKEQQFKQDNSVLNQKYTEQILNQLNEYVKQFGKQYNYTYVFGASSNGTLMYAKDAENITDEVLKFINGKYEGKNSK